MYRLFLLALEIGSVESVDMELELHRDKHIKYFYRVLGYLPSKYESEDSNKLAIIYFGMTGLDLLNGLTTSFRAEEIHGFVEWIYDHLCYTKDGFRGSLVYKTGESNEYDKPNLAATCFALQILLAFRNTQLTKRLDRRKVMENLIRCQGETGAFHMMLDIDGKPTGELDLRYCMLATTIRRILKWSGDKANGEDIDIDMDRLEKYIKSCKTFDGGLGQSSFVESHSGLTFCGLVALKNIGRLDPVEWQDTINFLVHRQADAEDVAHNDYMDEDDIGGFNGRINKNSDTCYAFWVVASLSLLGVDNLINRDLVLRYLLKGTQSDLMGGFTKIIDDEILPDPLHSFLGLAVLSILKYKGLDSLNCDMVVSTNAYIFWDECINW